MARYIELDALLAWAKETYLCENASMIRKVCYKQLLELIDTLEVKEVDLEKEIPMWIKENPRERPFDDGWFIGMDDCLHRNGYKIKICDLWNLPKEPFNSKEFETI